MRHNRRLRWAAIPIAATLVVVLAGCTQAQLHGFLPGFVEGESPVTNHTERISGLWLTSWIVLLIVGMVVWGLAYQLVLITSLTYRMQATPEHLLGRVNTAGRMLSWGLGWTLGSVAGGALAAGTAVRPAMVTLVCVGVLAAAFAWLSPLRRIAATQQVTPSG